MIPVATLERLETGDHGTFGRLYFGPFMRFTGELPDLDNKPVVSCIPPGKYRCELTWSPAFKRLMYLVSGVPNRSGIRIHSANLMGLKPPWRKQLDGCIAPGERLGTMAGQKAVLVSAPAVTTLVNHFQGQPFDLEIIKAY